ncbi:MAG TPA: UbiA family prenyltransferase [Gemmatimonadales bacterium]|nr:UbiA family prenyltransferase [Gemmatimonadales bacterium]
MSDLRAPGYRLLGRGFDYLLHLRPAEWPIMFVHLFTGSALSLGLAGLVLGYGGLGLLWGALAFVIGLNGGTLALNSAFDRDEGDVAYLKRPPPPPPGLALFGLALMTLGMLVALRLPRPFALAYALCAGLSVLYSVPPVRLKAVPGVDWLVNMAGFGFLTPYAGWVLTDRHVTTVGLGVLLGFGLLFGSLYPLTQIYQLEEDLRRGDRTFSASLGLDRSLLVAILMAAFAFLIFGMTGIGSGWGLGLNGLSRWAAIVVAAAAWAVVLLPWWRARSRLEPADHQAGMHRALAAWAITDMAVLFAWAR